MPADKPPPKRDDPARLPVDQYQLVRWALRHAPVKTKHEHHVLLALAIAADKDFKCHPKQSTLAAYMRSSQDTVKRALRGLIKLKLIRRRTVTEAGRTVGNEYTITPRNPRQGELTFDPEPEEQGGLPAPPGQTAPPTAQSGGGADSPRGGGYQHPPGGLPAPQKEPIEEPNEEGDPPPPPNMNSSPAHTRTHARTRARGVSRSQISREEHMRQLRESGDV